MPDAKEILQGFRKLLEQEPTVTTRRNAVRTFNDFLKVALKGLVRQEQEWIERLDIEKRFRYLTIQFPKLREFSTVISQCHEWRQKVDHSDAEAPTMSSLKDWDSLADRLTQQIEQCQQRKVTEVGRRESEKLLVRFVLMDEFEEVERLGGVITEKLTAKGLPEERIASVLEFFRAMYNPFYSWDDAKLESATDLELAFAIQATAKKNAMFSLTINELVDALCSRVTPKKETVQ